MCALKARPKFFSAPSSLPHRPEVSSTKPARRALPGRESRVPGRCREERERQRRRRRLENEEGACVALSVLRVVPAVQKPHYQEVRLGVTPEQWATGDCNIWGESQLHQKQNRTKNYRPGWERQRQISTSQWSSRVGRGTKSIHACRASCCASGRVLGR